MKSFGLWLLSVTLLGITLGCGDKEAEKPADDTTTTTPDDTTTTDPAP